MARGDALEADGRLLEAIDALTRANRLARQPDVERRLPRLRHAAFAQIDRSEAPPWPVVEPDPSCATPNFPVLRPEELTPEVLSTGIHAYGYVHVQRLIPESFVAGLVTGIDRAIAAADAHAGGQSSDETKSWFEPLKPGPGYSVGVKRKFVRESGGVWTGDSPRMLFDVLEAFEAVGLGQVIEAYLGERPALSLNKSTLKCLDRLTTQDWHQDGAFLGDGIRTVNAWMSLSHCGVDAPGLELVPKRMDRVLETGTEGAAFNWSVGPALVARVAPDAPPIRPVFAPGDVLLFDDLFLHRTSFDPTMTGKRYAIETWFFAPSLYPAGQIPIAF